MAQLPAQGGDEDDAAAAALLDELPAGRPAHQPGAPAVRVLHPAGWPSVPRVEETRTPLSPRPCSMAGRPAAWHTSQEPRTFASCTRSKSSTAIAVIGATWFM